MPRRIPDGEPPRTAPTAAAQRRSRRRMLGFAAGAVATGAAAGVSRLPSAASAQAPAQIAGVWMISFGVSDSPAPSLPENPWPAMFSADGGIVISFRPSTLSREGGRTYSSSALGQWTRGSGNQITWAYTVFNWDEQNLLVSRGEVRATVELDSASDRFRGTFTGGSYDAAGTFTASSGGTIQGQRLLAVPQVATP